MTVGFEYDVFLSHSSKDKTVARELAERLKGDGLLVWLDEWVIKPGDSIPLAIEQGLENSRTLVLVMSKNAFASDWVTLERHTVLFRDPTNQKRRFIPLRLDNANIKDSLKQFAYIDWRERDIREYAKLVQACQQTDISISKSPMDVDENAKGPTKPIVLRGHTGYVSGLALSPDGKFIISGAADNVLKIWALDSGECLKTLQGHTGNINAIAVTPDGQKAVSTAEDSTLKVWELRSGKCTKSITHADWLTAVKITPDGNKIVAGSRDQTIRVFELATGENLASFEGHARPVWHNGLAISPDGKFVVSASDTLRIWELDTGNCLFTLNGHAGGSSVVVVTLDCKRIFSGGEDATIKIWDIRSGDHISTIEGHTKEVDGLAITRDSETVISGSHDNTIKIWDTRSGACLKTLEGHESYVYRVLLSTDERNIISSSQDRTVRIWELSRPFGIPKPSSSDSYTNAKVLLVGDSGVGKSGLAIRLTENKFEPTVSTDAHWATQLKLQQHSSNTDEIEREIWLWDFAGQADYRLIHQLFMDETALAVLVFNPQSEDPFGGLGQWNRDISRAARRDFAKLLVAGRCDRGGLMVSYEAVAEFARQRGFSGYLETSALTGDGCDRLRSEIIKRIDWDSIPWTTSPRIFKLLKDEILWLRDQGFVLLRMGELKQQLEMRLVGEPFNVEELRAVVGLLAGPGLVWKLEFGDIVMLQPEWINKYAAAVIRSIRANVGDIGVIDEVQVLGGDLNYTVDVIRREADGEEKAIKVEMQRLDPSDETIVLRAMHQMFVDHGLCVREELEGGGRQLIFPSHFKKKLPADPGHPPTLVNYQFDGNAEEIYATLVVQLWQTKAFENDNLWRYAADFKSATGARLGLKMIRQENKKTEIKIYFHPDVQDDTKVTFIKYVHEHLLQKAEDVVRLRSFICPYCGHPVRDTELAREILNDVGQNAEIRCQQRKCDRRFSLWDIIEQKFASGEFLERVWKLKEKAMAAIDNESRELILEGHARVITGEAGQIYRGYTGSDHGIDGEIEFKDDLGQASGKRLYLQLKSGDSYLYQRKSDGAEIFQIKKQRWATYWREHAYPVMLVIRTSDGEIRWMNVTEYLEEKSKDRKTPVKHIVFGGQPFTALNLQRLRDRLLPAKERTLDVSKESRT